MVKEFEARLGIAEKDRIDRVIIELALERGQITRGEVVQKTKEKARTVYDRLSALVEGGILGVGRHRRTNFYYLTDEAEEALNKAGRTWGTRRLGFPKKGGPMSKGSKGGGPPEGGWGDR